MGKNMAKFEIECEQSLGWSHSGEVTTKGKSTVELSDEEVKMLVNLIREKGTADVKKLKLRKIHPALYKKLDEAYHNMAYKAEEFHWLMHGLESGYFDYDLDKVMQFCEENCGYEFVPTVDNVPDNIGSDFIAAILEMRKEDMDFKMEDFSKWLPDYLRSIDIEEACDFINSHLNPTLEMDDVNYVVGIPQAIIEMAKLE